MNPLGGDTRDLITLNEPHPAEHALTVDAREKSIRRFGSRALWSGISILFTAYLGSLAAAILADNSLFNSPIGQLFGVLGFVTLVVAGASLIVIGGMERLQRPQRATGRKVLAENQQMRERLDLVIGLVSPVPGRLDVIEHDLGKTKRFEDGVELGAELRRAVMGRDN